MTFRRVKPRIPVLEGGFSPANRQRADPAPQCPRETNARTGSRAASRLRAYDRGFLKGSKTWVAKIVVGSIGTLHTVSTSHAACPQSRHRLRGVRWCQLSDHSSASPRLLDFGNVTWPLSLSLHPHKVTMSLSYDNSGEVLSAEPNTRQHQPRSAAVRQ